MFHFVQLSLLPYHHSSSYSSTAASLPSHGELDSLDVNTVEDLPTDHDDWLCRRNQRWQPNVRHGVLKNGNGTGEIIVMEPPVIQPSPMVNILMTGRGGIFDHGLILSYCLLL